MYCEESVDPNGLIILFIYYKKKKKKKKNVLRILLQVICITQPIASISIKEREKGMKYEQDLFIILF